LELIQFGLAAFNVQAHVMRLDQLLNRIGELTPAPVFEAVHLATIAFNHGLVALDHGGHLLALIRTHDKHYFVVTHIKLLVDNFRSSAKKSPLPLEIWNQIKAKRAGSGQL